MRYIYTPAVRARLLVLPVLAGALFTTQAIAQSYHFNFTVAPDSGGVWSSGLHATVVTVTNDGTTTIPAGTLLYVENRMLTWKAGRTMTPQTGVFIGNKVTSSGNCVPFTTVPNPGQYYASVGCDATLNSVFAPGETFDAKFTFTLNAGPALTVGGPNNELDDCGTGRIKTAGFTFTGGGLVSCDRTPGPCNLIQNGDFSAGLNVLGDGSMPPSSLSSWSAAFNSSPQITTLAGCGGSPGYVKMWGNQAVGEGSDLRDATEREPGFIVLEGETSGRHRYRPRRKKDDERHLRQKPEAAGECEQERVPPRSELQPSREEKQSGHRRRRAGHIGCGQAGMSEDGRKRAEKRERDQRRCVTEQAARPESNDDERQQKEGQIAGARCGEIADVLSVALQKGIAHLGAIAVPRLLTVQRGVGGECDARQRRVLEIEIVFSGCEPLQSRRDVNRLVAGLAEDRVGGDDAEQRDRDERNDGAYGEPLTHSRSPTSRTNRPAARG